MYGNPFIMFLVRYTPKQMFNTCPCVALKLARVLDVSVEELWGYIIEE